MRMRFWATIRKPAFSISALTAPVRLRSVASGLMIEKVRSIAMSSSLGKRGLRVAGLISTPSRYGKRPDDASDPGLGAISAGETVSAGQRNALNYNNFTKVNPL